MPNEDQATGTTSEAPAPDTSAQKQSQETQDSQAPKTFKIAGEDVSLDEIEKGYLRTGDYTKKTQAVAEERRKLAGEKAQIELERRALETQRSEREYLRNLA